MKKQQHADPPPLRAAALTLLIAAVVLCMALLAVLCLTTARADNALADRQLQTLAREAAAETAGQQWLADAEAALAQNTPLPDGTVQKGSTLTAVLALQDGRTLTITAQIKNDRLTVQSWQTENSWQPSEGHTLWGG